MQAANVETESASRSKEAWPKHAFPLGRWTMLSKVSLFRNPFARTRKPGLEQQPLQTELVLDAVTPIRNDLSDADLEIISADGRKEGVATSSTTTDVEVPGELAPVSAKPQAPMAWEHGKTQFFGPGKP